MRWRSDYASSSMAPVGSWVLLEAAGVAPPLPKRFRGRGGAMGGAVRGRGAGGRGRGAVPLLTGTDGNIDVTAVGVAALPGAAKAALRGSSSALGRRGGGREVVRGKGGQSGVVGATVRRSLGGWAVSVWCGALDLHVHNGVVAPADRVVGGAGVLLSAPLGHARL